MIRKDIIELFRVPAGKKFRLKDHNPGWKQTDEFEDLGKDALKERAKQTLEQNLADLGIRWTTDVVYDAALADELLGTRQRRLTARDTAPPAPFCQTRGYGIATSKPKGSTGRNFAGASERVRVSPRSTAFGGFGQAGD